MIRPIRSIQGMPGTLSRMFLGAIFQREVRALGRRRMPYWVRFLYTLLLAGITALVFFAIWDTSSSFGSSRQSVLEEIAPAMLATIAVVQMVALGMIAPVLTAGAIADEKRQRTLSTLLTTPLTSRDMVLGKLGARTVQLVILSLVPMPLLLALRVFGGVEAESIAASVLLGLTVGLLGACLALMFSIWHRRTPSIVFFAMCATVVLVFLPLPVMFLLQWELSIDENSPLFKAIAPVALAVVLMPESTGAASVVDVRAFWITSSAYLGIVCLGIVVFSIFVLRGVLKREASGMATNNVIAKLVAPGVETESAQTAAGDRDARVVSDKPVLWRELRQAALSSGTRTIIAFGLGILILLVLYATIGLDHPGITITLLLIASVALTAQAALSTPTTVSAERDAGSWNVLLTTPVRARQIVLGKTLGAVRRLWLSPAVLAFHLILAMIAGWFHPIGTLHATLLLVSLVFMLASTGVCLGLVCKRGVTASVLNLCLPLVLFLGLPILIAFIIEFRFYNSYIERSEALRMFLMISNPFVMLQEAATTATADAARYTYFLRYEMGNSRDTLRTSTFTWMVFACSGSMAALGSVALGIAIAGFNRWTGRPS